MREDLNKGGSGSTIIEEQIIEWRRDLSASGFPSGQALDELESHLREEIQMQIRAGVDGSAAFRKAAEQLGESQVLTSEFRKTMPGFSRLGRKVRGMLSAHVPVPRFRFGTIMNTSIQDGQFERRWATYLKAAIFVLPAVTAWIVVAVMVLPALNDVYQNGGLPVAGSLSDLVRRHNAVVSLAKDYFLYTVFLTIAILALVEWRSSRWPKYRRAVIGSGVFLANFAVIISFFIMVLSATVAAFRLVHHS